MKKTYAIIALLCCSLTGLAARTGLRIEFNDGKTAVYALDTQPVVTFADADFTIRSADIDTSYPRADVRNFTFIDDISSRADIVDATSYSWSDNIFASPGQHIEVYALSGIRKASGHDSISLREFPDGIYIVRVGSQSIKVIKK